MAGQFPRFQGKESPQQQGFFGSNLSHLRPFAAIAEDAAIGASGSAAGVGTSDRQPHRDCLHDRPEASAEKERGSKQ
jgi:hypothetical protein